MSTDIVYVAAKYYDRRRDIRGLLRLIHDNGPSIDDGRQHHWRTGLLMSGSPCAAEVKGEEDGEGSKFHGRARLKIVLVR